MCGFTHYNVLLVTPASETKLHRPSSELFRVCELHPGREEEWRLFPAHPPERQGEVAGWCLVFVQPALAVHQQLLLPLRPPAPPRAGDGQPQPGAALCPGLEWPDQGVRELPKINAGQRWEDQGENTCKKCSKRTHAISVDWSSWCLLRRLNIGWI